MSKHIRIVEEEIETVKGYIDRHKGVGTYHGNCEVWGHHLVAYERILELLTSEARRHKPKRAALSQ